MRQMQQHHQDNQSQDLLYLTPSHSKAIKVKVLNNKIQAVENNEEFVPAVKLLYNLMLKVNADVLIILKSMNKFQYLTEEEFQVRLSSSGA